MINFICKFMKLLYQLIKKWFAYSNNTKLYKTEKYKYINIVYVFF